MQSAISRVSRRFAYPFTQLGDRMLAVNGGLSVDDRQQPCAGLPLEGNKQGVPIDGYSRNPALAGHVCSCARNLHIGSGAGT
jgi:hypothetical protein